jgi:2-methylisocitrate lyase-like PEP mutase family enzyme
VTDRLRTTLRDYGPIPLIGVYDVFSATLAARYSRGIFLSGFGFSASFYGLPDIGFVGWPDLTAYARRVCTVLPNHLIVVDIDDGFADAHVACHVVSILEADGVSGVVLEDQQRPRRCGHLAGKLILPLDDYLEKLNRVLDTRREMFVIARTDASDHDEILRRVEAFDKTQADAILVDGIPLATLKTIRNTTDKPLAFNQISGGKSAPCHFEELTEAGVSLAIYSTPCLFAAQRAIEGVLGQLGSHGTIDNANAGSSLSECNEFLFENLRARDQHPHRQVTAT